MAGTYLVLDHSALEKLFDGNQEFEVAVKTAALNHIAKQKVKLNLSAEVENYWRDENKYQQIIKDECARFLKTNSLAGSRIERNYLSLDIQDEVRKAVNAEFSTIVSQNISDLRESLHEHIKYQVESLISSMSKTIQEDLKAAVAEYFEQYTTADGVREVIENVSKSMLKEILSK